MDAAARANLDLLWRRLDDLPQGEPDLLGPTLDAAVTKLNALPDPSASSDYGVQLMTIHKSKGLEFEVVIVPDLQANTGRGSRKLLSWLERGLALDADAVDREQRRRDYGVSCSARSSRRVRKAVRQSLWSTSATRSRIAGDAAAALRGRHARPRRTASFARPEFKTAEDQSLALVPPTGSLLATAWPGLRDEVQRSFDGVVRRSICSSCSICSIRTN